MAADAVAQRVCEFVGRPVAETAARVRRQVGAVDRADIGGERAAAAERRAAARGVAGGAVADLREVLAACERGRIAGDAALRGWNAIRCEAALAQEQHAADREPGQHERQQHEDDDMPAFHRDLSPCGSDPQAFGGTKLPAAAGR